MPIEFTLDQRPAGYAASTAVAGGQVQVRYRELIGPGDPHHLQRQLENLQSSLFSKIPGLPSPSLLDHVLVLIRPDLRCTAYFNELSIMAEVRVTRAVEKGEPVYLTDIGDITSVDLGVDIPSDCGIVFVRSADWKRSLFFDFGPLLSEVGERTYAPAQMFAKQALLLLGIPSGISEESDEPAGAATAARTKSTPTRLERMRDGVNRLRNLLSSKCETEGQYQELLQEHPWMLGGLYSSVLRHEALNDSNIPDFTAVRCYDNHHDIVELKQPFLTLFKRDGRFTAEFNNAWDQAERYLSFATQQRNYLSDEKDLRFETPRCVLILGYGLSDRQLREIRKKETFVRSISVFTYDHLVELAAHLLSLMEAANELAIPTTGEAPASSALQLTGPSPSLGPRG